MLQAFGQAFRIKSPLNTKEVICIVKATDRRLIRARINDCYRRLSFCNVKLLLCRGKLKELIPTSPLDTVTTNELTRPQHYAIVQSKLTRLNMPRSKNGRQKLGQEYFSPSLRRKQNAFAAYEFKHSVTPKRLKTNDIVLGVESILARQRELPESTKDDIRSRIALTTISLTRRLQLDERQITSIEKAKKRQRHSHTSRGQRTCYCCYGQEGLYRQNGLTSYDKQTYEPLKHHPTPALQRTLNSKLLELKKTDYWHSTLV